MPPSIRGLQIGTAERICVRRGGDRFVVACMDRMSSLNIGTCGRLAATSAVAGLREHQPVTLKAAVLAIRGQQDRRKTGFCPLATNFDAFQVEEPAWEYWRSGPPRATMPAASHLWPGR